MVENLSTWTLWFTFLLKGNGISNVIFIIELFNLLYGNITCFVLIYLIKEYLSFFWSLMYLQSLLQTISKFWERNKPIIWLIHSSHQVNWIRTTLFKLCLELSEVLLFSYLAIKITCQALECNFEIVSSKLIRIQTTMWFNIYWDTWNSCPYLNFIRPTIVIPIYISVAVGSPESLD